MQQKGGLDHLQVWGNSDPVCCSFMRDNREEFPAAAAAEGAHSLGLCVDLAGWPNPLHQV
jgi:hypothetical protein